MCGKHVGNHPVLPAHFIREGKGLVQGLLEWQGQEPSPELFQTHGDMRQDICHLGQASLPHGYILRDGELMTSTSPGGQRREVCWGLGVGGPAVLPPFSHTCPCLSAGKPVRLPDTVPPSLLLLTPCPSKQPPQVPRQWGESLGLAHHLLLPC